MESLVELFPHARMFLIAAILAFLSVAIANIVDCVDAIITERSVGRSIESAKLRHALWKLAKEWLLLFAVLAFDGMLAVCWAELPFTTVVAAIVMVGVEVLSMVEHARLRKDKLTKLPSAIKDLVEYFGEDEIKEMLHEYAKRKLTI